MVDVYCLGVKDTFYELMTRNEYDEHMEHILEITPYPLTKVDPNYAFNIIYGAIEYAEDLGIEPHASFANTEYLIG